MFERDDQKNTSDIAKHGISFEFAKRIFEGVVVTASVDRADYGENREISIGIVERTAVLTFVHTDRNGICRIISARPASKNERKRYEQAVYTATFRR